MKKILALVLSLAMLSGLSLAYAESGALDPSSTLTVGTPEFNGDFVYDFTNNSYDKYVKDLTSGEYYYSTYTHTPENEFVLNEVVVKGVDIADDEAGNRTYTFELHDDLLWNDGTPITAFDYVFGLLVRASREWLAQGTTATAGDSLVGYEAYHSPAPLTDDAGNVVDADGNIVEDYEGLTEDELADKFAGVQLIDEYTFSVTIDGANLPYFYETSYAKAVPLASAVWAPGCDIESDAEGSRIVGIDLSEALATVAGTERYAPTVTCGPYSFVSNENSTVTLKANPYFKGDLDGELPKFENVVVKYVNSDTDVDQVITGEIDLTNGVVEGKKIEAAKAADTSDVNSYKRYGYGMIAFHCDFGPTADQNVRWGLACLIDRTEVLDYVLGGYGGTVDGPYGVAMWQYQEREDELDEQLIPISFNIEKANEYFDATEWVFEADGATAFDATKATADASYIRHNAAGEALRIEHMGSENNDVTRAVQSQFAKNAGLAGVTFNVTEADFGTLLDNYYYGFQMGDDQFYHSFNLANSFEPEYDPYYGSDHSDFAGTQVNSTQISDAALDTAIEKMRELSPDQTEEHADAFVEYVVRWNQLLPSIPLYSNEYFDIFNVRITGVETTPFVTWAQIVCKIAPAAE